MHNLTLKHFILKQEVINLYRHAVRASKGFFLSSLPYSSPLTAPIKVIPDPVTRRETVAWIRSEFERNRHLSDVVRPFCFLFIFTTELTPTQSLIEDRLKSAKREIKSILPTFQRAK